MFANISAPVAPGTSSVRACSRTSSSIERAASASAFAPGDVRLGGVPPVAAGTDDDVRDHGVALLDAARAGDVDRTAHLGRVRPREEVADELDRPAGRDLRRRLRCREELDLAHAGHGAVRDGLLARASRARSRR